MSAHFKVNVDCKTTISCLMEVQSKLSPNTLLAAPKSKQLNICATWTIAGLIPFHEAAKSLRVLVAKLLI